MIRVLSIGLLGLCVSALCMAQNAPDPRPSVSDLERELFGTTDVEEDSLGELGDEEIEPTGQQTFVQHETVILRALDKITGRSTDFEMNIGEPKVYGSLRVDAEACFQTPPEEPPESSAFLRITSATSKQVQTMAEPRDLTEEEVATSESEEADIRFSGWMYASSPGLNALEHPVYDIWVITCSEVVPEVFEPLEPTE